RDLTVTGVQTCALPILDFIHQHPFAFIAGCDENNKPIATQIPVFIEERGNELYLSGHMMKQTDHHKVFEKNPNVLCVFTGHHTRSEERRVGKECIFRWW